MVSRITSRNWNSVRISLLPIWKWHNIRSLKRCQDTSVPCITNWRKAKRSFLYPFSKVIFSCFIVKLLQRHLQNFLRLAINVLRQRLSTLNAIMLRSHAIFFRSGDFFRCHFIVNETSFHRSTITALISVSFYQTELIITSIKFLTSFTDGLVFPHRENFT